MKGKSSLWAAAVIAVSIIVLGFCLKAGIDRFSDRDRVVTVRGLCEKEVKANKVTWPVVTNEVGNDLVAIYSKIKANNEAIIAFLTANGLSESEISVNPPAVYDQMSDRYNSNTSPFRYQVTNVLVVTSEKVDLVQSLIRKQTELMQQGIAVVMGGYNYPTVYEYTDLNAIKPEMIAEATVKAREAAEKFASDSKSRLGAIRTASQGQFSISDRDQYTPDIKSVRVVTTITYSLCD